MVPQICVQNGHVQMHESPSRPEVVVIEIYPSPDFAVERYDGDVVLEYDVGLIVIVDWNVLVNTLVVDIYVRELVDVAPIEERGFHHHHN